MKALLLIPTLFLLISSQDKERAAVKEAFENYKKEILAGKGEQAVDYLDKTTIGYYEQILDLALHAPGDELDKKSIIDRLNVYSARHRVAVDRMKTMSGRDFIVYAIDNGMIGKNSVAAISIGDVTIDGTSAKGQAVANGTPTPMYFSFNKEDGVWKLDITSIFPITTDALKKVVANSDLSEDEFIFKALEMVSGGAVSDNIKDPLVPR